jgi:hypothetical protein
MKKETKYKCELTKIEKEIVETYRREQKEIARLQKSTGTVVQDIYEEISAFDIRDLVKVRDNEHLSKEDIENILENIKNAFGIIVKKGSQVIEEEDGEWLYMRNGQIEYSLYESDPAFEDFVEINE